jgi:hypothetical protein
MNGELQFGAPRDETLVVVEGRAAAEVSQALFGGTLAAGRLEYRSWSGGEAAVAACWFPPDRLELRVAAADGPRLLARLRELRQTTRSTPFGDRIRQLVTRLEAWSYADSDPGSGPAESMAGELRALAADSPSPRTRRAIGQALDALDDGLPAELIAGTLYRVLHELEVPPVDQASGLDPSASG